jgi:hypothetical protein
MKDDVELPAAKLLRPHAQGVIMEVLRLVAKTEIDDLTSVMDRLIETFMDEVIPIAVSVSQELVITAHCQSRIALGDDIRAIVEQRGGDGRAIDHRDGHFEHAGIGVECDGRAQRDHGASRGDRAIRDQSRHRQQRHGYVHSQFFNGENRVCRWLWRRE